MTIATLPSNSGTAMTTPRITTDSLQIVGILNITPDSFSDGGRYTRPDAALQHALELHRDGADIVDIGGESTRPGAPPVDPGIEQDRILPIVEALTAQGITVSVDTMHAQTAVAAIHAGASIINDVSGGLADPVMLGALAQEDCQVVLGHIRGTPATMQSHAVYADAVAEVAGELRQRVQAACDAGIHPDRIVIDPGLGFAKTPEHNWTILRDLDELTCFGLPVMVGVSRKRMLAELLPQGAPASARDLPTAVLSVLLAQAGVNAIRVHDVRKTQVAVATLNRWVWRTSVTDAAFSSVDGSRQAPLGTARSAGRTLVTRTRCLRPPGRTAT
ncbi:dihydropteroate synthase [Actinoallomurus sp. NBC_01490]|uniref:dihydropteroate synthase n=1 Tax=Actinoallomurus sp. NBC_01490 TaxID=2903557 RepID=UPI002E36D023|nr:dihydropteroate synthase [Actinoallomurus sp. NBC_01490]